MRVISFLLLVCFFSLGILYGQNELPLVLQERISEFDTISSLGELKRFEQVFGEIEQDVRVLHITKNKDSLVIYPMYKNEHLDNMLILTTKGKIYILNKESVLTAQIVHKTPMYKYFSRFFKVLDIDYSKKNDYGHWELRKHFLGWLSLKWKPNKKEWWDMQIDAPKKQETIDFENRDLWGQENVGGFDYILANHILAFVKSKSGENTTVEISRGNDADTIPTFYDLKKLGEYLDSTKIEIDTTIMVNNTSLVKLPRELYNRMMAVCKFKNSKGETIDDYFGKPKEFRNEDFEKRLNARFLNDTIFTKNLDGYFLGIQKELEGKNYDISELMMDRWMTYPACRESLKYLSKLK